jgi:hypothetical protein
VSSRDILQLNVIGAVAASVLVVYMVEAHDESRGLYVLIPLVWAVALTMRRLLGPEKERGS